MSTTITTAFVQQYKDNVTMLSQQEMSRLRGAVTVETVTGESAFFDRLGIAEAQKRTTRHGDTPLMDTPHTRRKVLLADYEWADLIDKQDQVRLLIDPRSDYARSGAAAMGRAMDDVIVAAALGTALTGKDGSGSQALPAGQKIAHGSAGLTIAKLVGAKKILDANEVDRADRHIAVTAEQLEDLLNNTTVTSSDYNTVKALVQGEIDTYLGFRFLHTERLTADANGDRQVIAWQKRGVRLAIGEDVQTRITERADKSYATQVYLCMSLGAVRMEEEAVVEIACNE